jgi:hypothetical protein
VFRCHRKVTSWGITRKKGKNVKPIISPVLRFQNMKHPTAGLEVLEMSGIDRNTCLVVVEEKMKKPNPPRVYGLILDTKMISPEILQPLLEEGFMNVPEDGEDWSPVHLDEQWKWLHEDTFPEQSSPVKDQPSGSSPAKKT